MSKIWNNPQFKALTIPALAITPAVLLAILGLTTGLSKGSATIGLLGSLLAYGVVVYLWSREQKFSASHLVNFITEVKKGSLPSEASFPGMKASTELEMALSEMVSGIRRQRDARDQDFQDLIEAMRKSGSVVGRMERGGNLIAQSSQTVSQGASTQAAAIEEVSSSLTQLQGQTTANAENASTASQLAEDSRISGEKGNSQMQEMIDAMADINDSSQKIAKIIQTIDEIAFQTNLLALNAAVEAARAGKYGKGFAVVAEEVRSLAARSAKAARETANMIAESTEKVDRGMGIAKRTGQALSKIVGTISEASTLVMEISSASQDQALGIQEITMGMTQIEEITLTNAAAAESNASSAGLLSEQAKEMRDIIGQYAVVSSGDESGQAVLMEWCDDFSVQVPEIDAQHKKLVDMINDLGSAMAMGKGTDVMQGIMGRLGNYVVEHFAFEEDLIRQAGYPDLENHIKVHQGVVAKFTALAEKVNAGLPTASSETLAFLQDWLINHIQKVDKKYTSCVLESRRGVGV